MKAFKFAKPLQAMAHITQMNEVPDAEKENVSGLGKEGTSS